MRGLAVAIVIAMLAGCASSPKTHFYVLSPVPSDQPAVAYDGPPLVVDAVRIPAYLDRPEIVRRLGRNQIDIAGTDHWGGPLGSMIRNILIQDLDGRLPMGSVAPSGQAAGAHPYRILSVTIQDFIADQTGKVTLDADWMIRAHGGKAPELCHQEMITAAMSGTAPAAQADAMSRALATLADHVTMAMDAGPGVMPCRQQP